MVARSRGFGFLFQVLWGLLGGAAGTGIGALVARYWAREEGSTGWDNLGTALFVMLVSSVVGTTLGVWLTGWRRGRTTHRVAALLGTATGATLGAVLCGAAMLVTPLGQNAWAGLGTMVAGATLGALIGFEKRKGVLPVVDPAAARR